MMTCLSCRDWVGSAICPACAASLRRGRTRRLDCGLLTHSAFLHEGAARALVHRLKYEGLQAPALVLARALVPLLPDDASVLVPVPRVVWRRVKYGIDPAAEIAFSLARISGLAVRRTLVPATFGPRHAGHRRTDRRPPRFGVRHPPAAGSVLIDDVLTTGVTLTAAATALGGAARVALTASSSEAVTSLRGPGSI